MLARGKNFNGLRAPADEAIEQTAFGALSFWLFLPIFVSVWSWLMCESIPQRGFAVCDGAGESCSAIMDDLLSLLHKRVFFARSLQPARDNLFLPAQV